MKHFQFLILVLAFVTSFSSTVINYQPTWDSLDSRPMPQWYDEAKVGIYVHWGIYSVPSLVSEWFWKDWKDGKEPFVKFMKDNYPPGFTYQEFAKDFKASFFQPKVWAEIFKQSGAKYVVLTSKHHDGYALWPSTYSHSWNSMDIGPNRDLIGDVASAIRNHTNLKFGVDYSTSQWFNPQYLVDQKSNWNTNNSNYVNELNLDLKELVERYRPDIVRSNTASQAPDTYLKSVEFLSWLYNESPVKETVVVNDAWGNNAVCRHSGFHSCASAVHKWENALMLSRRSWGYINRDIGDYFTVKELLQTLVNTVSNGGNVLFNVGPTKDGVIPPIEEQRLFAIGKWLGINGEAIYGSKRWKYQKDSLSNVWYTAKEAAVYAIAVDWPSNNLLKLKQAQELCPNNNTVVTLLGHSGQLKWKRNSPEEIEIEFPNKAVVTSEWIWTLKIVQSA